MDSSWIVPAFILGYLCVDLSMHKFISIPSTWLGWMEEQEESSAAGV